ncbi:MAG: hypothetical protein ACREL7_18205 [Longimicrobiales bacterium]
MSEPSDHAEVELPESAGESGAAHGTALDGKRRKRRHGGKRRDRASALRSGPGRDPDHMAGAGRGPAEPDPDTVSALGDEGAAEQARQARKVRGKRRQDLNQALVFELRTLRASLGRTLESIELRMGGRITELLHTIEGDPGLDQKPGLLTVKAAQTALAEIEDLRIKPKRGRLKDIRRIEQTLEAIRGLQAGR